MTGRLRETVEDVFDILSIETPRQAPQGTIIFVGQLRHPDSEAIYETIAGRWFSLGYTPLLSQRIPPLVALEARPGIIQPIPSNPWVNLWLAVATIFSVWFTGAAYECGCLLPATPAQWAAGLPMMLTMMVILAAHEFGHYFAAKFHKVAVTLPYFLPVPLISPVGTMGAFIQLRSAFKTRKQLFDIGVAGPLAGLVFAVPLIFWGVAQSQGHPLARAEGVSVLEGNSIFYLGVKYLVHGQLLPSFEAYADLPGWQEFLLLLAGVLPAGGGDDVLINSGPLRPGLACLSRYEFAAVGQFDGGHVVYSLLGGKNAYRLGLVLMAVMVVAGIFWWNGWLVWALLAFFVVGPNHPPPLNDLVPLGTGRKILAYFTIIIFIIMFMPNPLQPL